MSNGKKRSLSGKRYVYFWADGVYCDVRMDDKQCLLAIAGATVNGEKELAAKEPSVESQIPSASDLAGR